MSDIRQSSLYAEFMKKIGWTVEIIDGIFIYIKKLPFLPTVIKIQRSSKLPNIHKLRQLAHQYRAKKIFVEPINELKIKNLKLKIVEDSYLPTKTIHIDTTASLETIFKRFTNSKQRGIRHAQKQGVTVSISQDIEGFIQLKNHTAGLLGFLTTKTLKPLHTIFSPQHAYVLLANNNFVIASKAKQSKNYIAGILLLIWDNIAYYWVAAATEEGKKLHAPSLLVWHALQIAKEKQCVVFDFEGIYDERFPKMNTSWLGFTKFKSGFGGQEICFSKPLTLHF